MIDHRNALAMAGHKNVATAAAKCVCSALVVRVAPASAAHAAALVWAFPYVCMVFRNGGVFVGLQNQADSE